MSNYALLNACSRGDLEKVKFLVSKGADVKETDKGSFVPCGGCLISAIQLGSAPLIDYLIQQGSDINRLNSRGESALHIAASLNKFDCVKILMDNGARVDFKSGGSRYLLNYGGKWLDPLLQNVIDMPCYARAIKIQALELMGAVYVEEYVNLETARDFWLRSIEERDRAEPNDSVQPKTQHPHPAYCDAMEFHTVEDLDRVSACEHDMWLQALLIRYRILGSPNDPHSMFSYLLTRATRYLDADNYDRCIFLMKIAVDMQPQDIRYWCVCPVYDKLVAALDRSLTGGVDRFSKLVDVLEVALNLHGPYEWRSSFDDLLNAIRDCIGHFVTVRAAMSEEDINNFHQGLRRCIRLTLECDYRDDYQLLHSVCSTSDSSYPLFEVVELLLKAGAHGGARVGFSRDTPMHLVARGDHPSKLNVVKLLVQHCCQCVVYAKNIDGKWFTHYLPSEMGEEMRKNLDFIKLQCLSAKAVLEYAKTYEYVVPTRLTGIINLHK